MRDGRRDDGRRGGDDQGRAAAAPAQRAHRGHAGLAEWRLSGVLLVLAAAFPLALGAGRPPVRDALLVLLGLGAGMVLDEFVYLIVTPGTNAAYLSRPSWMGAIVMSIVAIGYVLAVARLDRRSREREIDPA